MVRGAVTEEVELLFFEAIFHLPSGTAKSHELRHLIRANFGR
jgi:hypothetical protein